MVHSNPTELYQWPVDHAENGKSRRVDLSTRLAEVLKQHLVTQELEALGKDRPKPEWVFYTKIGTRLDPDNVRQQVFCKLLEQNEIRRVRIHDLRHTFATRLLMNGESPAYVKEQMGHSSIQVTVDLYCHWIPGSNRQAVDRLDEVMDVQKGEDESATSRNHATDKVREEEQFRPQLLENFGAGERN